MYLIKYQNYEHHRIVTNMHNLLLDPSRYSYFFRLFLMWLSKNITKFRCSSFDGILILVNFYYVIQIVVFFFLICAIN